MCKMRVVVRREMLGAREQAWSLWTGKDVQELTGNQLRNMIRSNQKVCGLTLKGNDLVLDEEGFFTRNLIEHRYCGNYSPMVEGEVLANVFYIVIGSHEEGGIVYYDCISTKFEQAHFTDSDVKAYIRLGIISGGARLGENGEIELASLDYEKSEGAKPAEKNEGEKKK